MVDVTPKDPTYRRAVARGRVYMEPETTSLVARGAITKGDVLAVARVAAIQAAKRAADLLAKDEAEKKVAIWPYQRPQIFPCWYCQPSRDGVSIVWATAAASIEAKKEVSGVVVVVDVAPEIGAAPVDAVDIP